MEYANAVSDSDQAFAHGIARLLMLLSFDRSDSGFFIEESLYSVEHYRPFLWHWS